MPNDTTSKSVFDLARHQVIGGPAEFPVSAKIFPIVLKTLFLVALTMTIALPAKAVTMINSLPYTITKPDNYMLPSSLDFTSGTANAVLSSKTRARASVELIHSTTPTSPSGMARSRASRMG